jgi:hypothetical protein
MSLYSAADRLSKAVESGDSLLRGSSAIPNLDAEDTVLLHALKTWSQVAKQEWVTKQQEEPLDQDGKSVLLDWLKCVDDVGKSWKCIVPLGHSGAWCEHVPINRVHRAIAHVRMHLGLRPYPCGGLCGTVDWYVVRAPLHFLC